MDRRPQVALLPPLGVWGKREILAKQRAKVDLGQRRNLGEELGWELRKASFSFSIA